MHLIDPADENARETADRSIEAGRFIPMDIAKEKV
jgi:hypothetical protein